VILRAWDGVLRKNSLRSTPLQKTRYSQAEEGKRALLPLVIDDLARKLERV
jgi:hypothetical protein